MQPTITTTTEKTVGLEAATTILNMAIENKSLEDLHRLCEQLTEEQKEGAITILSMAVGLKRLKRQK